MKLFRLLIAGISSIVVVACSSSPSPVLPPLKLSHVVNEVLITHDWTRQLDRGASFAYLKLKPVIENNKVYSIDHAGHLQLTDLISGDQLWEKQLNTAISTGPSLQAGQLYVGSSHGEVIAMSAENGEVRWRKSLSSEVLATPRAEKDTVVVRTVDGKLYGLNATDGSERWIYSRDVPLLTLRGTSAPVISDGIVILGSDSGKLTALTLQAGTVLWETTVAVPQGRTELERIIDIDAELVVVKDVVYVVSYQGRLAAVQIDSGRIHWARDMSSYSGMAVDAYRVYLSDAEGYIWALNRFNGATIWRHDKLLRRSLTQPVLQKNYLVVADYDGYVHWLSREDGHLAARKRVNEDHYLFTSADPELETLFDRAENVLATPIVHGETVFALDRMGLMSAFTLQP